MPINPVYKNGNWSNPLRRWFYHKLFGIAFAIVPFSLACSFILSKSREPPHAQASTPMQVLLEYLPLRSTSRLAGAIASSEAIPQWVHHKIISLLVQAYDVDLADFQSDQIRQYSTLQDFFTRSLKATARPINTEALIVSPCDSTVQKIIRIESDDTDGDAILENVKGDTFRLSNFLHCVPGCVEDGDTRYALVLHLGPGDYHHFHAPKSLDIMQTIHVPGKLFPVHAHAIKWLPRVFVSNERVILRSEKCIMGLVGASMVGSICLPWESRIKTNSLRADTGASFLSYSMGHEALKGDDLGHFECGSCVVLVVDVPTAARCVLKEGSRVRVGEGIFF